MNNLQREFYKKEKAFHRISEGDTVQCDAQKFDVVGFDKQRMDVIVKDPNDGIEFRLYPQHIERHNGRFF